MDVLICAGVLLPIIALIVWYFRSNNNLKTACLVPGLKPKDDKDGNMADITAAGSFSNFLATNHKKFGPLFSFYWGKEHVVSIASPELFKEQVKLFDRPALFLASTRHIIGEGSIQFTNGERGKFKHATYSSHFRGQALHTYFHNLKMLGTERVQHLLELPDGEHIPLRSMAFEHAISAIVFPVLGSHFQKNKEVITTLKKAYDNISKASGSDSYRDDPEKGKLVKEYSQEFRSVIQEALDYRRTCTAPEDDVLVDVALNMDLIDSERVDDLTTFFIGGFHNTASLMMWTLYLVATHHDVQDKIRTELDSVLGDGEIKYEHISQLRFIRQVIDESIRLSVTNTFTARSIDKDTELGGYIIPANMAVLQSLSMPFRDSHLYPEPDKFDPERFAPNKIKNRPKYSFEPFGFAGGRRCPGYLFTYMEVTVFVAQILRYMEVTPAPGEKGPKKVDFFFPAVEEIWITMSKRK